MGSRPALLLIDFINTLDFDGGEELAGRAVAAARHVRRLKRQARAEDVPTIYVNDHFGDWSANFDAVRRRCERSKLGRELTALLRPMRGDLSILKPRHSAFYGTPLEYLLRSEGIDRVVMTGQATEQCILYSALDAYVRELEVAVPRDAVAHIHDDLADAALRMMETNMSADVTPSADCHLRKQT